MTMPVIPVVTATVLIALLVTALRRCFLVVTVDGVSMAPTFRPGDRLIARRWALRAVRAGDVVVLRSATPEEVFAALPPDAAAAGRVLPPLGGGHLIKRIVAVPGDRVPRAGFQALHDSPGDVVPPGKIVVAGDNPRFSADSRTYGYLRREQIVGVVMHDRDIART
ncbi:S26 family signal peptidase [Sphaerisporangium krabiense]|uniref:Signal peptidase I n=1 Tax=Sphaerisporangium krabiense TaxID=763782 RepID=A0A7W9DSB7_9ACTN|nr:signal peptidase I [Sphaerisporangium krabiense]MBB5629391.1 signal peptidase I [Sphaerisporangium krabiense]GII65758.1 S26 family signal peptidase [Sphaerisporangium krabiense]